jgi:hypothetical protein
MKSIEITRPFEEPKPNFCSAAIFRRSYQCSFGRLVKVDSIEFTNLKNLFIFVGCGYGIIALNLGI